MGRNSCDDAWYVGMKAFVLTCTSIVLGLTAHLQAIYFKQGRGTDIYLVASLIISCAFTLSIVLQMMVALLYLLGVKSTQDQYGFVGFTKVLGGLPAMICIFVEGVAYLTTVCSTFFWVSIPSRDYRNVGMCIENGKDPLCIERKARLAFAILMIISKAIEALAWSYEPLFLTRNKAPGHGGLTQPMNAMAILTNSNAVSSSLALPLPQPPALPAPLQETPLAQPAIADATSAYNVPAAGPNSDLPQNQETGINEA